MNGKPEIAPVVDLDPWEYWDPVSNPYRNNKTNNNAQIEIEMRGRLVEKIDIDLGRHCSKSSEGEPHESNAKPIEETNIWAPVPKWRMNNNIQIHEQEDESPNGYRAKSAFDSTTTKDNWVKQSDCKPKKSLRLKQGFFTKLVILSLAIGRCVTAKNIDGLMLKN